MISPSGIPQFTGDFDQLDRDVSALRSDAVGIRNGGMDVHSRFQMLQAFYTAPEADDLFATTQPVMDKADAFAAKLETVADALDTFSIEARPLAKRLEQLKADALAFVASVDGDDKWTEDEDKVHRNKQLVDDVTATQFAFQEAERRAAGKISKLVGGPAFVADHGSGSHDRNTVVYGYDLGLLEGAKELPWGSVDEQSYEAWSLGWFGHGAKTFVWDGIYHDGIEAGVSGLWTLVGGNGSDAAGDAWSGLKDVVTGIGLYTASPYDAAMDWAFGPAKESADEIRAKKAAKEFGKSLVAWDQWQENPTRAAGTTVFNVLTLGAGPLAVVSKTSEVGAVAKSASVAAKVGEFMDPVSVGLKATGKVVGKLPTLSDLTSRILTGADAAGDAGRVHSVIELEDGSKVVIENGEFIAFDKHGDVIHDAPKQERSSVPESASDQPRVPEREPTGVGAASRPSGAGASLGDGASSRVGHDATAGNGHGTSGATGAAGTLDSGAHPVGASHGGTASSDHMASDTADAADNGRPGTGSRSGGVADPDAVMRHQVYRANHEPGYFEKYYRKNGTRLSTKVADESGLVPPQLVKDPSTGQWIAVNDAPSPLPPKYTGEALKVGRETATPEALKVLDNAAHTRHSAIAADQLAEHRLKEARHAFDAHPTDGSKAAVATADAAHKPLHKGMSEASEAFGEAVAEHHVIPEHYPHAKRMELDGPANGNDQFDQVWQREDGGFVVVEAKSSTGTQLGARNLPDGTRVSQGTREYFNDILREMRIRGRRNPKELKLATALNKALRDGKLDYILVKGNPKAGRYDGYLMEKFDIGGRSTP
ncbi:hypothetical protein ACFW08_08135 [Streptomyces sp. NPDC058960]|uniref:hypothetical protein n=1 Tax=Streptomyces sp. NPDC058960 TaxID=3346679 RepID=UPI0036B05B82